IALVASALAAEEKERPERLARLQAPIELLPATSPLRGRVAAEWLALAIRTYDAWRLDRFGCSTDQVEALIGAQGRGQDSVISRMFKDHAPKLLENTRQIFDAFGRAVTIDPARDRYPEALTPTFTLVRLVVRPEKPAWGETRESWEAVMTRLRRAEHPIALFVQARYHPEEMVACMATASKQLAGVKRDDMHVRGLAHGFVELGHLLPAEQLVELARIADYSETWTILRRWKKEQEHMPDTIKGELFFVSENSRQ
ncbi:MAG: hypothetical protein ACAI25_06205, partial [Planctomycetota bacterium]